MSYIICWIFNTSLILSRCFSNQLLRNIINIHCQSLVRFIDNSGGPFGPLCRLYTEFYIEICNSSQGLLTVISLSIISPPYYWKLYSGPFHSPLFLPHTFPMMSQLPITVTSFFHLRLYPTFLKQQVSIFLPIDMLRSVETYIRWKYQLLYIVAHGTLPANHPFFYQILSSNMVSILSRNRDIN